MPEYELIYFNAAGRAEPIRLILHYGGIPFKDTRLDNTEWPTWKNDSKKIPFGMIPVLNIDDKPLCESHTITRFVAKLAGIDGGSDPVEVARLDQTYEMCRSFYDATTKYLLCCLGFTQDEKSKLFDDIFLPNVEKHFNNIRSQLKSSGFFGDKITYVDIYWSRIIEFFNKHNPEIIQNYPEFLEQLKNVNALPELQSYFKTRPETRF